MVSLSTLRADVYSLVRTAVDGNKLSGTTVINSFPEASPSFPCYIIPMPDVDVPVASTIDGVNKEYRVFIEFVCYASATGTGQGQAKVAAMLDNLQSTLENGTAFVVNDTKVGLVSLSYSPIERLEVNQQKLYAAGGLATFAFTR